MFFQSLLPTSQLCENYVRWIVLSWQKFAFMYKIWLFFMFWSSIIGVICLALGIFSMSRSIGNIGLPQRVAWLMDYMDISLSICVLMTIFTSRSAKWSIFLPHLNMCLLKSWNMAIVSERYLNVFLLIGMWLHTFHSYVWMSDQSLHQGEAFFAFSFYFINCSLYCAPLDLRY